MTTLAINKDLHKKVVPTGQNFANWSEKPLNNLFNSFYKLLNMTQSSGAPSNVVFNLYKLGKLHKVDVDKTLPTDDHGLMYVLQKCKWQFGRAVARKSSRSAAFQRELRISISRRLS